MKEDIPPKPMTKEEEDEFVEFIQGCFVSGDYDAFLVGEAEEKFGRKFAIEELRKLDDRAKEEFSKNFFSEVKV